MKKITLMLLLIVASISGKVSAQCTPQTIYTPSAWAEPTTPTTQYTGFLCQGHDTIITRTGWDYYDGDGYRFALISGSDVTISAYNCVNACDLTIVDSTGGNGGLGVLIPGAYVAAACPNSLNFIAPYTGIYYLVFNTDGDCSTTGLVAEGLASIKLNNPGTITNCTVFAAPSNDTICGAVPLSLNTPVTGNTTNANSADPRDGDVVAAGYVCSTPNNTIWYSYTPAVSDSFAINTTSPSSGGLDGWVGVFEATNCNDVLTYLNCLRGSSPGGSLTGTVNLTAGTTYFFMVDGFIGAFGEFTIEIVKLGVSVAENNFSREIKLFPNPSTGIFKIINNSILNDVKVSVTNVIGEVVYIGYYKNLKNETLNLSDLNKGLYILNLQSKESIAAKKLVIE